MSISKYHVSTNKFDKSTATLGYYVNSSTGELSQASNFFASDYIPIEQDKQYYWNDVSTRANAGCFYDSNKDRVSGWSNQVSNVYYFTTPTNAAYVRLTGARTNIDDMQLNEGSTALPYEPYGDSFKNWFYRKYGTETETFNTYPHEVIGDGTALSAWSMKGNMSQSGTPTPSNPIYPQEVGDLVTTGEHAGEYEIPILSNGVRYPIYLSEPIRKIGDSVDTAPSSGTASRVIKKVMFDGSEDWQFNNTSTADPAYTRFLLVVAGTVSTDIDTPYISDRFVAVNRFGTTNATAANVFEMRKPSANMNIYLVTNVASTAEAFKTWLASNPLTIYYISSTPTTETFTAPSIPTSGSPQSFDVSTTLKPSEVSLTWHGWHEHSDTKYSNP